MATKSNTSSPLTVSATPSNASKSAALAGGGDSDAEKVGQTTGAGAAAASNDANAVKKVTQNDVGNVEVMSCDREDGEQQQQQQRPSSSSADVDEADGGNCGDIEMGPATGVVKQVPDSPKAEAKTEKSLDDAAGDGAAAAAAAEPAGDENSDETRLQALVTNGIDERIAGKLGTLFESKKLSFDDLDERAFEALKEFGTVDGALAVLAEFDDSNLEHVSNKSAFLCGIMKAHRQKEKAAKGALTPSSGGGAQCPNSAASTSSNSSSPSKQELNNQSGAASASSSSTAQNNNGGGNQSQAQHPGPDEAKLKAILDRTGYTLDITSGQRKYGGPPPGWEGNSPGHGSEVFVGKIPKEIFEDEIIPLFEECGVIWDLRLMVDPLSGFNRGYCFITYCNKDDAHSAQEKYDGFEIRKGKNLKVNISVPNLRLFVGNIPKSKTRDEIHHEFSKLTGTAAGLNEVIVYSSPDDRKRNRGFCFLEYDSHKSASLAKRKLSSGRTKVWGCDILVDWADPQEEPDQDTMNKVKVLYVRNLVGDVSEEQLREAFEKFGSVERVKKIKDYAFVHFDDRDNAMRAMMELNGKEFHGICIEVSLAKPPSDRKKKEEILRNRERRVMLMMQQRALMIGVPGMPRGPGVPMPPVASSIPPPPPVPPMMPPRGGGSGGRNSRPPSMPSPSYGHRGHGGQMPRGAGYAPWWNAWYNYINTSSWWGYGEPRTGYGAPGPGGGPSSLAHYPGHAGPNGPMAGPGGRRSLWQPNGPGAAAAAAQAAASAAAAASSGNGHQKWKGSRQQTPGQGSKGSSKA